MNTDIHMQRIALLSEQIMSLNDAMVERQNSGRDIASGSEDDVQRAEARATEDQIRMASLLRAYFIESEFVRRGSQTARAA